MDKPREHGMLFSPPMARAIHDGRKTVTRRLVEFNAAGRVQKAGRNWHRDDPDAFNACPYGIPGDLIWVREAWRVAECYDDKNGTELGKVITARNVQYEAGEHWLGFVAGRYRHARFMPRWAARSVRRIVSVRPERLQDITEVDARAEGITDGGCCACGQSEPCGCDSPSPSARDSYCNLWDSLNANRGFDWASNPWVWRIEFEKENVS